MLAKTDAYLAPRPVFIIGCYRSATSITTWALGQHPNLFPLEETHFIYKLAADLDYHYEVGANPGLRSFIGMARLTPRDFRTHFGLACSQLIETSRQRISEYAYSDKFLDKRRPNFELIVSESCPKQRWIDGTPENAHYVLSLLRLFPEAKFIHILRNPKQVAKSLMHFSSAGGRDYHEEEAYRTWTHMVTACATAAEALGPERVLSIRYEDIAADPRAALQRCLEFVGEPFHPDCVLPLKEKINSSQYEAQEDCSVEANIHSPSPWIADAFTLYRNLLEGQPLTTGPIQAFRQLRRRLHEYQLGLRPDQNERLLAELKETKNRLRALERPLQVLEWGPQEITAGEPFNEQPDGSSAVWVHTRNAPHDTVIEVDGVALRSSVHSDGNCVTALMPREQFCQPGPLTLFLRSKETGQASGPLTVACTAP